MGTLFPHSDEYPDHKPVPSPLDAAKDAVPTVAMIGLVLVTGEGPDNLVKPDMRNFGRQAIELQSTATSNITPLIGLDQRVIFPQALHAGLSTGVFTME